MTRVLVVDDKPENLYLLRALLRGSGFDVQEAQHGQEALDKARLSPPDVVVSDLLMPVMDGYTLLRHWKADAQLRTRPFIVYTATYTDALDEQLARDLGADAFILKPAEPDVVLQRLREVLASARPAAPTAALPEQQETILREYNVVLLGKLEDKMRELEAANRRLRADAIERERLLASEQDARRQIAAILESVSDAFVSLDRDWRYTYVNERAAQIFNRRREDLIGRHIWTEFPEGIDQPFYHAYHRAFAEQRFIQVEEYYPPYDRWFENRIYPSAQGLSIFFHDVTDRKRAELALLESEARLRLAAESSNTGLWAWDLRTHEVYYSPIWKRQIGYRDDEVPHRFEEWRSRVHPEDLERVEARIRAYLASPGEGFENEFRFRHRDGSYRWILARAALEFDEDRRPIRILGSHLDITERKEAEQRLEESRGQLRALLAHLHKVEQDERTQIAREIHDELGQLLTGLKMDLHWIERTLSEPGVPTSLNPALDRAVAASELVDTTIAAVRKISAALRPDVLDNLGLAAALAQRARRLEESSGIACAVELPESPPALPPETANELFAIAQEALTNVVRHARASRVAIRLALDRDAVRLDVQDDGVGIGEADLQSPRTLGLIGMRERAVQIGATIDITRAEPRGTRVAVRAPLSPSPSSVEEDHAHPPR